MFDTGKRVQALQEQAVQMRQESEERLRQMDQRLEELSGSLRKNSLSLEDLLDTLEEWQEEQSKQNASLQESVSRLEKGEAESLRAEKKDLLNLIITCCDQLFVLRQAAADAGSESWARQLLLAENAVREQGLSAGLQIIGEDGDAFSYDLHEPIEKVDTDRPELNMTLARIYQRGYWYRTNLLRKARVAVYTEKGAEK